MPALLRSTPLIALAIGALGLAPPLRAQGADPRVPRAAVASVPVVVGERTSLRSEILGEDRPIEISLPPSYERLAQRYPVLFVLDGETHFLHAIAAARVLAESMRVPEMIVVSIPNTRDRTHDLTPPARADSVRESLPGRPDSITVHFTTAGGAEPFLRFLVEELAPWVDRHYRTAPYRILFGHSFGGLFVLNALAERPDAFRSYIAVSPSLWWDEGRFGASMAARLHGAALRGRSLYMTTGEQEGPRMIDPALRLATSLQQASSPGFRTWYQVMAGENHGTTPHRTIYEGLETIFAPWALPDSIPRMAAGTGDLRALDAHFLALAKELGTEPVTPEPIVSMVGFASLQVGLVPQAVQIFGRNVERFPNSADAHASLAIGFEASGQLEEALSAQREAVRIAEALGPERAAVYRERLRQLEAMHAGRTP